MLQQFAMRSAAACQVSSLDLSLPPALAVFSISLLRSDPKTVDKSLKWPRSFKWSFVFAKPFSSQCFLSDSEIRLLMSDCLSCDSLSLCQMSENQPLLLVKSGGQTSFCIRALGHRTISLYFLFSEIFFCEVFLSASHFWLLF